MADNINLLPQQKDENLRQTHQRKLINRISAAVLIVTILIVVGLFAVQFVLAQQITAVDNKIAGQTQRIEAKSTEEGIQRSLIDRLHALDGFLDSQSRHSQFLNRFEKTIPDSLRLKEMIMDEDGAVSITGAVANYSDLSGFYNKLRLSGAEPDQEVGTDFIDPLLTSVSRSEGSGTIEFGMTFDLGPSVLSGEASTNGEAQ